MAPRANSRVSPRKQPRQARAAATVEAILEATAHILVKDGFHAASTNQVARRAGVSIGSLYQYFPSKEALVIALMQRHGERIVQLLESTLQGLAAVPLRTAVPRLIQAMLDAHALDPRLHAVMSEQEPRLGGYDHFRGLQSFCAELIRQSLEARRAQLRVKNLELATFLLVSAVESVTHGFALERPAGLSDAAVVKGLSDLVLRYLLP